jgi:hypothetical protein
MLSDEELFGSAHGERRSYKHELRLLLVRSDARLWLRLCLRAQLWLLRKVVLLRTVLLCKQLRLWLREELLLRTVLLCKQLRLRLRKELLLRTFVLLQ